MGGDPTLTDTERLELPMGALKPWHIAVLVVVLILLFGAKRLPDAARSLGRSLRIIKAETKSLHDDDRDLAEKADAQNGYQPLPPQQPIQGQQQYAPQPGYAPQPQPGYAPQPQQPVAPPVDPVQRVREN
ncbi:sec-independent protein translocase protein TatA [Micromonospora sediminicola]|uniref:Sec-independent protein translocase protein TatA n=2 Tax=Micromonosporaceae TaxID=28056 RepID=A0A1A9BDA3_9ACTN|nr:sec-independent protein translocase protein TatA [Micromonospora sediminicola]